MALVVVGCVGPLIYFSLYKSIGKLFSAALQNLELLLSVMNKKSDISVSINKKQL